MAAPFNGGLSAESPAPPSVLLQEVEQLHRKWFGDSYDLDALRASLAANAISTCASGEPLWILLVGSPGCCKTETTNSMERAGAKVISSISSPGALLSATDAPPAAKGKDKSNSKARTGTGGLLVEIGPEGFLVIKDFTTILSMNHAMRQEVLAALREIYDGYWVRRVGSKGGQILSWRGRLGVLGAVTDAWEAHHEVIGQMGNRFLLLRIDSRMNRRAATRQAMSNTGKEKQMRSQLETAVGRLIRAFPKGKVPKLSAAEQEAIIRAADLTALARTPAHRDYKGDVLGTYEPEMPTRLVKQLMMVMQGGIIIGMERGEAYRLALRCARDTVPLLRGKVLGALNEKPAQADVLAGRVGGSKNSVRREVSALQLLGLVEGEGTHPTTFCIPQYWRDEVAAQFSRKVTSYIYPSISPPSEFSGKMNGGGAAGKGEEGEGEGEGEGASENRVLAQDDQAMDRPGWGDVEELGE